MAEATFKPFTIEHLRAVGDFARSYLWDVVFPEAPDLGAIDPIGPLFLASDLEESSFGVESGQVEYHNIRFQFPKSLTLPKITLTFYDREDRICYKWIRNWIANTMFNLSVSGTTPSVAILEDIVKEMYVTKLTHDKQIIDMVDYWVYPESIGDHCNSENNLSVFSVPFVVAGMNPIQ